MTVDELIEWSENHPSKTMGFDPFPIPSRRTLEEMDAEGYWFEIRDGAPYIGCPGEERG